jgi:peptide/nickel transport system substrate-binding protein
MLAAAGYANGFDVTLDFCTCDRLDPIEGVTADLARIGVKVTINQLEISQFNQGWGKGTNPMRSSRLGFTDPSTFLRLWLQTPSDRGGFLSRYSNPQMDKLIDQQSVTYDHDQRVAILHQIGALSHDDPPAIFLFHSPNLYATNASVKGWQPHFIGYIPVLGVSLGG